MRISIIIPTRGRSKSLKRCLASIKKYTKDYEVVLVERKGGYNEKVNEGLKKAKGDYLIILHDDHEVTEGWADELGEVGSFQQGENGNQFIHWGGFYHPYEGYLQDIFHNPQYPSVPCLSRQAFKKIGFLDEFYQEPGYQDVDLGYQIAKAGYKIQPLGGKVIHWAKRTKPLEEKNRQYLNKKWKIC